MILSKLITRSGWGNIYRKPRLPVTLPSTSSISNKNDITRDFHLSPLIICKKNIKKYDLKIWFSRQDLQQKRSHFHQELSMDDSNSWVKHCGSWAVAFNELPESGAESGAAFGDAWWDSGSFRSSRVSSLEIFRVTWVCIVMWYIYIYIYTYVYLIFIYIYIFLTHTHIYIYTMFMCIYIYITFNIEFSQCHKPTIWRWYWLSIVVGFATLLRREWTPNDS